MKSAISCFRKYATLDLRKKSFEVLRLTKWACSLSTSALSISEGYSNQMTKN